VTDAGWYPHAFQVGQTGKTVVGDLFKVVPQLIEENQQRNG
jgi:electron transfer flavoprotein alpha subunit